ncbi:hypothetical protein OROMI_019535 [Orobanche minor]
MSSYKRKFRNTSTGFGTKKRYISEEEEEEENRAFEICPEEEEGEEVESPQKAKVMRWIEEDGVQFLRPGMILLKNYLSVDEQIDIVRRCRNLGSGPGGFYIPRLRCGAKMNLHLMCLGLDWDAQSNTYGETRKHDGARPPAIPHEFSLLVRRAVNDSHRLMMEKVMKFSNSSNNGSSLPEPQKILPAMCPDVCVVNFYTSSGRLNMHQDDGESHESLGRQLPVVSVSLGDSAEFLYGTQKNANKANKVLLESGDVLLFGGKSRDIFHGVSSIIPNTAPPLLVQRTKLRPGRLNLTFRQN